MPSLFVAAISHVITNDRLNDVVIVLVVIGVVVVVVVIAGSWLLLM